MGNFNKTSTNCTNNELKNTMNSLCNLAFFIHCGLCPVVLSFDSLGSSAVRCSMCMLLILFLLAVFKTFHWGIWMRTTQASLIKIQFFFLWRQKDGLTLIFQLCRESVGKKIDYTIWRFDNKQQFLDLLVELIFFLFFFMSGFLSFESFDLKSPFTLTDTKTKSLFSEIIIVIMFLKNVPTFVF